MSGSSVDSDELARDARALPALEVARLSPDGAAERAAREHAEDGSCGIGIEHDGRLARGNRARAELAQGAAGGLLPYRFGGVELVEEAPRGPMIAAPLFAIGILGDGDDAERRVRPLVRRAKPARQDNRRAARGSPERGSLAVRDACVEGARGGFAALRNRDGFGRTNRAALRIEELEIGGLLGIAKKRRVCGPGVRDPPATSSASSSASLTKRAIPSSESSLVDVVATCLPFITRKPAAWWPASSTSSGSPSLTFAESSAPLRTMHSATVAPPRIARCDDRDHRGRAARPVARAFVDASGHHDSVARNSAICGSGSSLLASPARTTAPGMP